MPKPKAPTDRLAKKPRTVTVPVLLDDELAQDLENAEQALLQAEQKAEASRDRYIGVERRLALTANETVTGPLLEERAQARIDADLKPARAEVEALKAEVEKATQLYVFRAIGRDAYRKLQDAHPPTEQDHKDLQEDGGQGKATFCLETFAPALVQASCVDPVLDDDAIEEIFHGTWNESELGTLFQAAQQANITRRVVDLGKARR